MPNKETKRERKEQAKAQRMALQRKMARRKAMRKVYVWAIAAVVVAAIVAGVLISNSNNKKVETQANKDVLAAATALDCGTGDLGTVKTFPAEGRAHVASGTPVKYQTDPPTSGDHWSSGQPPYAPGPTGVLAAQPQDEQYVHNLEHSHMGIWYDASKLPADVKAALETFTKKNNTFVFMSPRTNMNAELALTSWTHWIKCGSTMKDDPAQVTAMAEAYFKAHAKKDGPEGAIAGTPGS